VTGNLILAGGRCGKGGVVIANPHTRRVWGVYPASLSPPTG